MEQPDYFKKVEELILEKIKFGMNLPLDSEFINSGNIELYLTPYANQIIMNFRTRILGQRKEVEKSVVYEFPKNWFEHLKQDYAPKWILKRFPVKTEYFYKKIVIDASALFPELGSRGEDIRFYSNLTMK